MTVVAYFSPRRGRDSPISQMIPLWLTTVRRSASMAQPLVFDVRAPNEHSSRYNLEEPVMNRMLASIVAAALAVAVQAAQLPAASLPYDETANAAADVQHALATAHSSRSDVLLVFGANWCPDCRELDKALNGSSHALIAGRFQIVKIDVGQFDKNLELANQYGNPIGKGIPAVVVLSPDNRILYSSKAGELANARRMGEQGIYDFLASHVAATH